MDSHQKVQASVFSQETWQLVKTSIIGALKQNLAPGMVLLVLEIILVVLYFQCIPCLPAFTWLKNLKVEYGYFYSALSAALFGGVFPWCIGLVTNEVPRNKPLLVVQTLFFLCIYWALIGLWVDVFYQFQGWLWGTEFSYGTIAAKVAFDMFVYNPLLGVWIIIIPFHWRTCEFNCRSFYETLTLHFLIINGSCTLALNWATAIPSVTVIYSLPSDLQVPVWGFILCFYNLLLLFVTRSLASSESTTTNGTNGSDIELTERTPLSGTSKPSYETV